MTFALLSVSFTQFGISLNLTILIDLNTMPFFVIVTAYCNAEEPFTSFDLEKASKNWEANEHNKSRNGRWGQ